MAAALTLAAGPAGAQTPSSAASLRQRLVVSNMDQCTRLLTQTPQLDPYAPKNPALRVTYCNCVSGTYAASMPDTLLVALYGGPLHDKPGDQQARVRAAAQRLDAARQQCAVEGMQALKNK
jgi:hypothetical protein